MTTIFKEAQQFAEKNKISLKYLGATSGPVKTDLANARCSYLVQLSYNGKSLKYWYDNSKKEGIRAPKAGQVICKIFKNNPGTFAEFCENNGFQEKETARKEYSRINCEYKNMKRVFGGMLKHLQDFY